MASWREAYRAFGAKPQRTRNSLEALLRRVAGGRPRVNRLTDCYNAVSVLHQVPIGGEDLARYASSPRLIRAAGTEFFDTVAAAETVIEHPEPGEVVWCDSEGVTCRRWNWRQGRRTQLREDTTTALFILDALAPMTDEALHAAADDLVAHLIPFGPSVLAARHLITGSTVIRPRPSPDLCRASRRQARPGAGGVPPRARRFRDATVSPTRPTPSHGSRPRKGARACP